MKLKKIESIGGFAWPDREFCLHLLGLPNSTRNSILSMFRLAEIVRARKYKSRRKIYKKKIRVT